MTPQQAIRYLNELMNIIDDQDWGEHDYIEAIELGQNALKKELI